MECVQDYFQASVAPVKRVVLNYGPTGRSRGSATVYFSRPGAAAEAVSLDGTPIDGKKMRVRDRCHLHRVSVANVNRSKCSSMRVPCHRHKLRNHSPSALCKIPHPNIPRPN